MNLVTTEWLEKNLDSVKIFDASWHMPSSKRNGKKEYEEKHIKGAIFWDVDEHSNKESPYPHMMSSSDYWTRMLWSFGIQNNDHIVVYDNSDTYSSCRLWFALKYFGHQKVSVLDGGMKKWLKENRHTNKKTKDDLEKFDSIDKLNPKSRYKIKENIEWIKNKKQIDENINTQEFNIVDARSRERFEGKVAEPRKGLRSGSIKNSFCLPFSELVNEDHTFVSKDKIMEKFKSFKFEHDKNLVFSCGSGVTASVLALAYSLINAKYMPTIYDGSWAEYGKN